MPLNAPNAEVLHFTPVSLPKAPNGTVRAARDSNNQTLLVVRDLALALDYTEHRLNLLLKPNMQRPPVAVPQIVRSANTGMLVRTVTADGAAAIIAHVEKTREIARSFGHPSSRSERDSVVTDGMPVYRIGPFNMNGKVYPAIDVPVAQRAAGGTLYIRSREIIQALGLSRSIAQIRLQACLAPSRDYTSGPQPYFHRLFTDKLEITFGQRNRPGVSAGKATLVWPLELAPLLFEALARGRPRGKPSHLTAHHATAQGRATGQYHPVEAPAPTLVSAPPVDSAAEVVL